MAQKLNSETLHWRPPLKMRPCNKFLLKELSLALPVLALAYFIGFLDNFLHIFTFELSLAFALSTKTWIQLCQNLANSAPNTKSWWPWRFGRQRSPLGRSWSNARCPKPRSGKFWKLQCRTRRGDGQEGHHPPQYPEEDGKAAEHSPLLDRQAVWESACLVLCMSPVYSEAVHGQAVDALDEDG